MMRRDGGFEVCALADDALSVASTAHLPTNLADRLSEPTLSFIHLTVSRT